MGHELDCYAALRSRDMRFDGVFFVGVKSTRIYCRPVCPARTPKRENCRFFTTAAAAEAEAYRPCLRCRPELSPGAAPIDDARRISHLVLQRIEEQLADDSGGVEELAREFELSSRQLRRIVKHELGASPVELLQTRRLLLAKQLLTETDLSMIDVAFASGFGSVRRFNDSFRVRYRLTPSEVRRSGEGRASTHRGVETSVIRLHYRPPYDWDGMLRFLEPRVLRGVELIEGDAYIRTARLGGATGWIRVRHDAARHALALEFTHTLVPVLAGVVTRVRALFDTNCRPDVVAAHLSGDARLASLVSRNPGLRVPGAFDGFELAVRAILGQQITVSAAATLGSRFVEKFGVPVQSPISSLTRRSPPPERVAELPVAELAKLGIIQSRARTILSLARAVADGAVSLEPGSDPYRVMSALEAIPGIGRWTAEYVAMRALRWPDAFPKEDIALRKKLGGVTPRAAELESRAWSPWRSYAVLHLWRSSRGTGRPA